MVRNKDKNQNTTFPQPRCSSQAQLHSCIPNVFTQPCQVVPRMDGREMKKVNQNQCAVMHSRNCNVFNYVLKKAY